MKQILIILAVIGLGVSCSNSDDITTTTRTEFTLSEISGTYFSSADTWVITDSSADYDDFEGLSDAIEYLSENTSRLVSLEFPNLDSIPDRAIFGDGIYDYDYSSSALAGVSADVAVYIGKSAFRNCSSLAAFSAPNANTVGERALYSCTALESINIPLLTKVQEYTFSYSEALQAVSMPLVTSVADKAFLACTVLGSVDLDKATSIGGYAFYMCSELITVELPVVTTISEYAFGYCTSLIKMSLATDSKLESIDATAFDNMDVSQISLTVGSQNAEYVSGNTLTVGEVSLTFEQITVL